MHEMSLVQSIMNIVAEERARHKLGPVTRVTLMNGRLAGAGAAAGPRRAAAT